MSCCGFTVCGGRTVTASVHQCVALYVPSEDSWVAADVACRIVTEFCISGLRGASPWRTCEWLTVYRVWRSHCDCALSSAGYAVCLFERQLGCGGCNVCGCRIVTEFCIGQLRCASPWRTCEWLTVYRVWRSHCDCALSSAGYAVCLFERQLGCGGCNAYGCRIVTEFCISGLRCASPWRTCELLRVYRVWGSSCDCALSSACMSL